MESISYDKQAILEAVKNHEALDEIAMSLLPDGSRLLVEKAVPYLLGCLRRIDALESAIRVMEAREKTRRDALIEYSNQTGQGGLFWTNLKLCEDQVRMRNEKIVG